MKLRFARHGGHCCGIVHLYGFDRIGLSHWTGHLLSKDEIKKRLKESIHQAVKKHYTVVWRRRFYTEEGVDTWKCLIEVNLSSAQLETFYRGVAIGPTFREALEEVGFKEVNSFHNSNSTNKVHVFHLNHGE